MASSWEAIDARIDKLFVAQETLRSEMDRRSSDPIATSVAVLPAAATSSVDPTTRRLIDETRAVIRAAFDKIKLSMRERVAKLEQVTAAPSSHLDDSHPTTHIGLSSATPSAINVKPVTDEVVPALLVEIKACEKRLRAHMEGAPAHMEGAPANCLIKCPNSFTSPVAVYTIDKEPSTNPTSATATHTLVVETSNYNSGAATKCFNPAPDATLHLDPVFDSQIHLDADKQIHLNADKQIHLDVVLDSQLHPAVVVDPSDTNSGASTKCSTLGPDQDVRILLSQTMLPTITKDVPEVLVFDPGIATGDADDVKDHLQRTPLHGVKMVMATDHKHTAKAFFFEFDLKFSEALDTSPVDAARTDSNRQGSVDNQLSSLCSYRGVRGLCACCAEKWHHGHQCATNVQLHVVEAMWELLQLQDAVDFSASATPQDHGELCANSLGAVNCSEDPRTLLLSGSLQVANGALTQCHHIQTAAWSAQGLHTQDQLDTIQVVCLLSVSDSPDSLSGIHPAIVQLLEEFKDVFAPPTALPPTRQCDHAVVSPGMMHELLICFNWNYYVLLFLERKLRESSEGDMDCQVPTRIISQCMILWLELLESSLLGEVLFFSPSSHGYKIWAVKQLEHHGKFVETEIFQFAYPRCCNRLADAVIEFFELMKTSKVQPNKYPNAVLLSACKIMGLVDSISSHLSINFHVASMLTAIVHPTSCASAGSSVLLQPPSGLPPSRACHSELGCSSFEALYGRQPKMLTIPAPAQAVGVMLVWLHISPITVKSSVTHRGLAAIQAPMQVGITCLNIALRPSPWPSFRLSCACSACAMLCTLWKPPWPYQILQQKCGGELWDPGGSCSRSA